MDNLIANINTRQVKVSSTKHNMCDHTGVLLLLIIIIGFKIAADYAKQNYPDFAVVVQPFFSKAKADKFPVEFLSNVWLSNHFRH